MSQLESISEIRAYFELKYNESIDYQNLWDIAKQWFRGNFLFLNVCIRKGEIVISGKIWPQEAKTKSKLNTKGRKKEILKNRN